MKTITPLSEGESGFALQLSAQNVFFFWLQDDYNFFGVAEGSIAEHDSRDLHEPPLISYDQVSLYFPHEREGKPERYTTDFRALDSEQEVFTCVIDSGNGIINLMRLSWPDVVNVPHAYQLKLTDPELGISLNMREVHEYWFLSFFGSDKRLSISMDKVPE
jgi:hypothetical protein